MGSYPAIRKRQVEPTVRMAGAPSFPIFSEWPLHFQRGDMPAIRTSSILNVTVD